jgi:hypothetical protein
VIVHVGMSPQALIDIGQAVRGRSAVTLLESLQNMLLSHGCVYLASSADAMALLHMIKSSEGLSPQERVQWSTVFAQLKSHGRLRISSASSLLSIDDAPDALSLKLRGGELSMIAIPRITTFDRLFPDTAGASVVVDNLLEVTTSDAASASSQYQSAQKSVASESFAAGLNRQTVWQELFSEPARLSKTVTVFDRYIFRLLSKRESNGDAAREHIQWFLESLDQVAPNNTAVFVYGSLGHSGISADAQAVASILSKRWTKRAGRISQVTLIASTAIKHQHHDRHVIFGDSMAFDLPGGLDRLGDTTIPAGGFSYSYKWRNAQLQVLRNRETETVARAPVIVNL